MFASKPSNAVNTGMAKEVKGRQHLLSRKSSPSVKSLVGWLVLLAAFTVHKSSESILCSLRSGLSLSEGVSTFGSTTTLPDTKGS